MSLFSVGLSGLNAAQVGLSTASHNIANASTPGFNRQEIVQGTNTALATGNGYIGQGTNVQTVQRVYDQFLGSQVLSAETGAAEMNSYTAQISQIDNLLADPSGGLSPALSGFFTGVQGVAANPASIPARQSMLSAGQALVSQFQALDQRLSEIRTGTNQQIATQITQINTYSSQLADINQRIMLAQSGNTTQQPNDLLDQRDQMVQDLNKLVRVTPLAQTDGSFSVFMGNGQPLVMGSQSYQLKAVPTSGDPGRTTVAIVDTAGTARTLPETQITGGSLGGLLSFRSQTLDATQNSLGRIALTVAQNFNDQNKLGQDLNGVLGKDFFSVSAPVVLPGAISGTGAPTVNIDPPTINQLTSSDYQLSYDALGNYTLTRLSDKTATPITTDPQLIDGMSISISTWTPTPGASFLIQPTRYGASNIALAFSDPRQIAAAAPIRTTTALANTGTASISAGTVNAPPSPPSPATDPNLQDTVTISFSSATLFTVFDVTTGTPLAGRVYPDPAVLPPPAPVPSGADLTYNGWTVHITGNPAAGDTFTVERNTGGVGDNRNAALMGSLQTSNTMMGSTAPFSVATASYQSAYAQIVSAVGSKANEVQAIGAARKSLADQATQTLQSFSGVNLDEEATNLMRYQQAYQASAKVLSIASKIFDQILALGQ